MTTPTTPSHGWLYILHFNVPHHHARHYCGATTNPPHRLAEHWAGCGASLTRFLRSQGRGWTISMLAQAPLDRLYQLELQLKRTKNVADFCYICNPQPKRLKGTLPVDPTLIEGMHHDDRDQAQEAAQDKPCDP